MGSRGDRGVKMDQVGPSMVKRGDMSSWFKLDKVWSEGFRWGQEKSSGVKSGKVGLSGNKWDVG